MKLLRIAFCAALCVLTAGAFSQTSPGDVVVDVPFAFSVAGKKLPAGHYIVKQQQPGMIRIFSQQNKGLFVATHGALRSKEEGSKLVFHRYGDSYFLSSVWVTGNKEGKELVPSPAERELKAHAAEMEMAVVRPVQ